MNIGTISHRNRRQMTIADGEERGYVRLIFGNTEYRLTACAAEELADEIASAAAWARRPIGVEFDTEA